MVPIVCLLLGLRLNARHKMATQTAVKVGLLKGAVCSMETATRERRKRLENRKGRKTLLKRTTEKREKGEDGERKEGK